MTKRTGARTAAGSVAAEPDDRIAAALSARLGHAFSDPELLSAALTHPSLTTRAARHGAEFERLEFLGDRVLSLVIADWLFQRFPSEREGDLAKRHAELVRRESLARMAAALGLDRALRLSASEAQAGGAAKAGILADAFEAVLGAVFRDGGLEPARALIRREFAELIDAAPTPPRDAKTALQEWTQARGKGLPNYRTISHEGPAHRPRFVVEVTIAGLPAASGEGSSKRIAEQAAAQALLERLPSGSA